MVGLKNVIILHKNGQLEAWGNLRELCDAHENFSYASLRARKYPFVYKGYDFIRLPYRMRNSKME